MSQGSLPLDGEREIFTVSEILSETRWALENTFTGIWVRGEITGVSRARSGHWYFQLKDDQAVLPTAMFRSDAMHLPFELQDGIEVLACGRLSLYEPQGRFQLIANALEPAGWGAQQLAFEQLKQRLAAEGLFDEARKRPLPLLPSCVGVVTSSVGAAWHDMRIVWERRAVPIRAVLSPSRVQGEHAATEIATAIELLAEHGEAEVLIVGRGGGSREDLWAFNEEIVARAIAECPLPVISAVGHEVDFTIADWVADRRAATPTAAAEIVAPSRAELEERAEAGLHRVARGAEHRLARAARRLHEPAVRRALAEPSRAVRAHQQRLDVAWEAIEDRIEREGRTRRRRLATTGTRLVRHEPSRLLADAERGLAELRGRLRAAATARTTARSAALRATAARTEAMSPLQVLGRGYALCQDEAGQLLRDAATVSPGDGVRVRLHRGELDCEVKGLSAPSADTATGSPVIASSAKTGASKPSPARSSTWAATQPTA